VEEVSSLGFNKTIMPRLDIAVVYLTVHLCAMFSYYDINSVRQNTTVFITQDNYVGYMFRLLNSHLQSYSLQVKLQDAVSKHIVMPPIKFADMFSM